MDRARVFARCSGVSAVDLSSGLMSARTDAPVISWLPESVLQPVAREMTANPMTLNATIPNLGGMTMNLTD
jgi:hypothetical protein